MRLSIDAWLERRDPRLRLIDVDSGREILRLGEAQVRDLMESGDLCPGELSCLSSPCAELVALLEAQSRPAGSSAAANA